jgi:hypothetical protein
MDPGGVAPPGPASWGRLASSPWLFLSYTGATGSVKLFNPYTVPKLDPTNYKIGSAGPGSSIMSVYWQQFMWLSGQSPYITRAGNPSNADSQWLIELQRVVPPQ